MMMSSHTVTMKRPDLLPSAKHSKQCKCILTLFRAHGGGLHKQAWKWLILVVLLSCLSAIETSARGTSGAAGHVAWRAATRSGEMAKSGTHWGVSLAYDRVHRMLRSVCYLLDLIFYTITNTLFLETWNILKMDNVNSRVL